jgi:S-adenosylmethionine-dependent methyltransferase
MHTAQIFDERVSAFKELQQSPWGRIRYSVSIANVQRHINKAPSRVLDVGGGNGLDTLALATQGHSVTLLDLSTEMLAEAERNVEKYGVAERVTFRQADLLAVPSLFPEGAFDLILCHNVLQFVEDVSTTLQAICHPARPGGIVSILGTNRYSEAYRQALQQLNLEAAYASLSASSTYSSTFNTPIHMQAAEELNEPLQNARCEVIAQYGVRCLCDYVFDNEIKNDPTFFAQLERLEYAMSDLYPYYLLARLYQVIARKGA